MKKRTYYLVTSKFYDDGKAESILEEFTYEEKPEDHYKETDICDIWYDWFSSKAEAKAWQKKALEA